MIIESRDRSLTPAILIELPDGTLREYALPVRSRIQVDEGDTVQPGQVLAKLPRQTVKTRDITGGLPRVIELFEARTPSDPAIVSEIEGYVEYGARKRGAQEVIVTSPDGTESRSYLIPLSKYILVHPGDYVQAGQQLSDGQVAPQDILRILGPRKVQEYLVNEIQEVYRLQGVSINDKHIEVIVRQMMQKVRVTDPGDTNLLEGDLIDRVTLEELNEKLYDRFVVVDPGDSGLKAGDIIDRRRLRELNSEMKRRDLRPVEVREAQPAVTEPILLGITQAALSTESFISAASFQETTKVLTDAAVAAKTDYLYGLKENVIVGHLIPAGTGQRRFQHLVVGSRKELEALQAAVSETVAGNGATESVEAP
ncbi:Bifunctional DNA-directed RNA polymerase subunit beta-beta' [bacterium HR18]|nr:Bifunctional DNA-directed RNA polymerase subunit beta-beta' [bacterium HR18]